MVAQLRPRAARPVLLLEPDRPSELTTNLVLSHGSGWRRARNGDLIRWYDDDEQGALIQRAIVRYLVHGVQRQEIAREIHYSERQIQSWVQGRTSAYYSAPVRRALQELGIGMGRGGVKRRGSRRASEVVEACLGLLADVPAYLPSDRPRTQEINALARLLTAGREPLG